MKLTFNYALIVFLLIFLVEFMATSCLYSEENPHFRDKSMFAGENKEEKLIVTANNMEQDRTIAFTAIFSLFADYVKPSEKVSSIKWLYEGSPWLQRSDLMPLSFWSEENLINLAKGFFCYEIQLGKTHEKTGHWSIILCLTKKIKSSKEGKIAITNESWEKQTRIVGFSLIYPNGRIKKFTSKGIFYKESAKRIELYYKLFEKMLEDFPTDFTIFVAYGSPEGSGMYTDVSDDLYKRLKKSHPNVKQFSKRQMEQYSSVKNVETERQSCILSVTLCKWISGNSVEVEYHYYIDPFDGDMNKAIATYNNGEWVIEEIPFLININRSTESYTQ